jgi:hypothetical protein
LKYYGHDERLEERVLEIVETTGMVDHGPARERGWAIARRLEERGSWTIRVQPT